ncbi:MAG TPA: CBS domain-containing protein [Clostridia bacterium]|nr:CBS domain-containing protein [Clostridia bacterium]
MWLSERQKKIVKIVQEKGPIIGEEIANHLGVVRSTLRADFAFLTKSGFLGARPRVGYYYTGKKIFCHIVEAVRRLKVKDWQAVPVVVGEGAMVYEAIVNLFSSDVGTLYIVSEGGVLEGVVSRKDLLKIVLGQADIQKIPVNVIMTRMPNIVTISPEDSLWSAAQKIVEHEVDSLPVVKPVVYQDREGLEVVGRVTKTTITSAFVHIGQHKYMQEE